MRRSGRLVCAALALAAVLGTAGPAAAYDSGLTHRWIARKALEYLRATYPGRYDDILPYLEEYLDGVADEDNDLLDGDTDPTTLRVMRHFFQPTDRAGLTMVGQTFPNSYEWGVLPQETNEWGYDDALDYWRAGDKARAFSAIGHVMHLLQDATVPAHTHLDIHGPPHGDDFENYCMAQMRSEEDGDLAQPSPGTAIPEFASLEDMWLATARASYYRNTVPGALSDVGTAQASGTLAEMFPQLAVSWVTSTWKIPGVGTLDDAFWEYAPGSFYFKYTNASGAIDRVDFDPAAPEQFSYGPNPSAATLSANMARDLIPIAILNSAALLKHFDDEIREIAIRQPDIVDPDGGMPESGCGVAGGGLGPVGLGAVGLALSYVIGGLGRRRRIV